MAAATGIRLVMEPYPAIVSLGGDLPVIERQAYFPDDVLRQFGTAQVILAGARAPISYFGYEGHPSELVTADRLTVLGAAADDNAAALEALADRLGAPAVAPVRTSAERPAIGERLTADAIVEELIAQLPEDAVISLEGSTLGGPYLRQAHRAARHRVMTNTGGAIGQGLPCAVGGALAAPGARVVALQSDGSGHYTLQALWTMARERLPVTIVIAANHRYGILQTELTRAEVPLDQSAVARLTRLDNPRADWTALAAVLIATGYKLCKPKLFTERFKQGWSQFIPFIVTILAILRTDLLIGILVGLVVGFVFVVARNFRPALTYAYDDGDCLIRARRNLYFIHKYELQKSLAKVPDGANLLIDLSSTSYVDLDNVDIINAFIKGADYRGISVVVRSDVAERTAPMIQAPSTGVRYA